MSVVDTQTTCFRIPDGATLLLVDDDPLVRRALRRMIEVEGTSWSRPATARRPFV